MIANAVNDLLIDPILNGFVPSRHFRHRQRSRMSGGGRLSVLHDAESGAWHSKIMESSTHVVVDWIELRAGLRGVSCGFHGDSAVKIAARLTISAVMISRVIRVLLFMIVAPCEGGWLVRTSACQDAVGDEHAAARRALAMSHQR
jgi:hypothetical protein